MGSITRNLDRLFGVRNTAVGVPKSVVDRVSLLLKLLWYDSS